MSNYNREHNLIFIHIPKNAGSSMESKPFIGGNGHETLKEIKQRIGESRYNRAFKFTFVRNPLDRFVSNFFSKQGMSGRYPLNQLGMLHFLRQEDLTKVHFHFRPQHTFINPTNELDFIGRYENLERDWNEVCRRIKTIDTKLPWIRKNKTREREWQEYYTPESEKRVREYYKKDFELFGYE